MCDPSSPVKLTRYTMKSFCGDFIGFAMIPHMKHSLTHEIKDEEVQKSWNFFRPKKNEQALR